MPDNENILYNFEGDSSSLEDAAQGAIDALDSVDRAISSLGGSNPFLAIERSAQSLNSSVAPLNQMLDGLTASTGQLNQAMTPLAASADATNQSFNTIGEAAQGAQGHIIDTYDILDRNGSYITSFVNGVNQAASGLVPLGSTALQTGSELQSLTVGATSSANSMSRMSQGSNAVSVALQAISAAARQASASSERVGVSFDSVISAARAMTKVVTKSCAAIVKGYTAMAKGLTKAFSAMAAGALAPIALVVKALTGLAGAFSMGKLVQEAVGQSSNYVEALNMFVVAAGDMREEMQANMDVLSQFGGLAPQTLMEAAGSIKLISTEMGLLSKDSALLSNNLTNAAVDLSSLFNKDFTDTADNLASALQGNSRAVRKFGIDITDAGLQQTAYAYGITKSVEVMNQAEKVQLRYATIIRQTSLAQGDFARTIEQPANMLRIFKEQTKQAATALGNVFMPVVQAVMPMLVTMAYVLQNLFKALAKLTGYKAPEIQGANDQKQIEGVAKAVNATTDALKKQKKAQKALVGGFDELNVLGTPVSDSGGDGSVPTGAGSGLAIELPEYDSMLDQSTFLKDIQDKAEKLSDTFKTWAAPIANAFSIAAQAWAPLGALLSEANAAVLPALANAIQSMAVGGLAPYFQQLGNTFSVLTPLLADAAAKALPALADAFNAVSTNVSGPMLQALTNIAAAALPALGDAMVVVGKTIVEVTELIGPPLAELFSTLGTDILPPLIEIFTAGLSAIDWDKLSESFAGLWESLSPFASNVGEGLLWFFDNVLVPLGVWAVNDALPVFLDVLSSGMDVLNSTIDALKPLGKWLWDSFLQPLAEWTGGVIVGTLKNIAGGLKGVSDWVKNNQTAVENIAIAVGSVASALVLVNVAAGIWAAVSWLASYGTTALGVAMLSVNWPLVLIVAAIAAVIAIVVLLVKNFDKIKEVVGNVIKGVKDTLGGVADWFNTKVIKPLGKVFSGLWDGVKKGFVGFINFTIKGINTMIKGYLMPVNLLIKGWNATLGKITGKIPEISITIPSIPALATGGIATGPMQAIIGEGDYEEAVIPLGNSPQMAQMLDDFGEVVSKAGGGNGQPTTIQVFIDGDMLKEWSTKANRRMTLQTNGGF